MIINIKDLTISFDSRKIIDNLNLSLKSGNIYIIQGASGSGKTTLLNAIAGYIDKDTGSIEMEPETKIEYLFQDEMLFSNLTVRENMKVKYGVRHKEVDEQCEDLFRDILEKVHIGGLIDSKVAMLSGGERQRVQIANMLLSDPDIILMDEPTSKLDTENKVDIVNVITEIFSEKILVIVSHDNLWDCIQTSISYKLYEGKLIHHVMNRGEK